MKNVWTDSGVAKVILLTQPYAIDGHMTEEEQMNVYRKIVSHYGEDNVVIKPHPRDKCDYKVFFFRMWKCSTKWFPCNCWYFRCGV